MAVSTVLERHGLSQRHACRLVGMDRSTLRYRGKRPDDWALRQRVRELAAERRRFGYRRWGWMLAREGRAMNHKRLYRLYREEQLAVRRRGRRKRAFATRAPMAVARAINQHWSLDFGAPWDFIKWIAALNMRAFSLHEAKKKRQGRTLQLEPSWFVIVAITGETKTSKK